MTSWDYEHAYPGGPMVGPELVRPLYPPDAEPAHTASAPGPDVVAVKRGLWRGGRWPGPASAFDEAYSNKFAHGKSGNVGESGVAGFQRQMRISPSGWVGKTTFNALRSARIPQGLPHAGEPLLDQTAIGLLEQASQELAVSGARERAMEHQSMRVGYTEQPANSNCDNRPDGIRTAQDHCADGTWLRGTAWCGSWAFYALETAGVTDIDYNMASVAWIEDTAKKGARCFRGWTTDRAKIKTGDLVLVGSYGQHVEMVRGAAHPDGSVPTYGGNTSPGTSGSQSNGGGAYARTRYPSEIRGFALVRFPGE